MRKLFGTDGVRGIANEELTCELAYKIGRAGAVVLTQVQHKRPVILIGKDTRISGDMLEAAMISGICSVGADVMQLGIIPTPAVAYLVRKYGADAGVVISASHNPMEHNGIKFFSGDGYKLSDDVEERIEELIFAPDDSIKRASGEEIGRVLCCKNPQEDYVAFLRSTTDTNLFNMKIAIDCANGAAYKTAPMLFGSLDATYTLFNASPNGTNINAGCGSTHIERFSKEVALGDFDIGVAFDGDADRCILVDSDGNIIDGDKIISVCAKYMKEKGKLKKDTAVVTILSNMGLHKMAKENNINIISTAVGDRYVLEEMMKGGYSIGGEQSGHIIFLDYNTTGDGELSALQFISIMKKTRQSASELASVMQVYPQVMMNVKVKNDAKREYEKDSEIVSAINEAKDRLGEDGRILIRPSGTEPLIRVMVEGRDFSLINDVVKKVSGLIEVKYGA